MKQFNLEEYLKDPSQKIVTKEGKNVRILCTDRNNGDFPIVALMDRKGDEVVISCNSDGVTVACPSLYSLYFADKCSYYPYTNADECFKEVIKHGGWVKCADEYFHIYAVCEGYVLETTGKNIVIKESFEELLNNNVWADDNTSCGTKDE